MDIQEGALSSNVDLRYIETGAPIYDHGYCDQPYVVIAKDGTWICTFTTGTGSEGDTSQYVVAATSADKGKTWSDPVSIESPDGPEASWVMPLMTKSGRVYAFYDFNGDNVRTLPGSDRPVRVDMLGWYCYRYSDDNGKTWSDRHRLPVRVTACDRKNQWKGEVQIMWGIGKPITYENTAYLAFTKLGRYILDDGEGWFFRSDNILTEPDVTKVEWQMLPDGEHGVRAPEFGSVQEEHNIVPLSNGDLYCMYRTTLGHTVHSYSRDGGHSWSKPEVATYSNGRQLKNPRACPRIWKTKEGKYLFWFHNHSGKDFSDRNPAWLSGGIEKDGIIHWSEPEICLYGHDHSVHTGRFSYPDLIQQDGRYWITTTQKTRASVHSVDPELLEGLWNQGVTKEIAQKGLVLSLDAIDEADAAMPKLPSLQDGGFSLDLWVTLDDMSGGQVILDSRDGNGRGVVLSTTPKETVRIDLNDGAQTGSWDCDEGMLECCKLHHVVIIVDGGPRIITFVVDGVVCDGGKYRQYGWGRFDGALGDVNGSERVKIAPALKGKVKSLRIYDRYLRNSEAVGNFNSGMEK